MQKLSYRSCHLSCSYSSFTWEAVKNGILCIEVNVYFAPGHVVIAVAILKQNFCATLPQEICCWKSI